jgi:hypothetical protein
LRTCRRSGNKQIEMDSKSGKLDFLIKEALDEKANKEL